LWVFFGFVAALICVLPVSALGESSLPEEKAAEYHGYISNGQQHLDNGRHREAISNFNRALLLDPSSEEAKEGIIRANREIAERSTVPDVVSIEKDRLNYHLTKGTEHYDAEKYDEAIAQWREALRIDPENRLALSLIDAGKRAKVDLLMEKGHDEFFAGDIDKAIAIWEEAREIVPASAVLDDLLAEAELARHEKEAGRITAQKQKEFMQIDEYVGEEGLLPEGVSPDGIKRKDISERPASPKIKEFGVEEILKELSQPVAFEFECEPLRDVVRFLTSITGINILTDEEIFEKFGEMVDCYGNEVDREEIFITIHVSELPLESALNGMLRQHGLGFLIERYFIYISTPDVLRGSSFEQLETRFYHLKDTSRVSLPKLESTGTAEAVSLGGEGEALELAAGGSLISRIEEIPGESTLELDADYGSMSVPKLVNILRTFVPTVVDQSKSEEEKKTAKLAEDVVYGGVIISGEEQPDLFDESRRLWVDSNERQVLSLIEFDPHTNTIIARNTPSNLDTLEVFLDHLDNEPRQIAVEAKFIQYSIIEAEKVGIDVDIGGTSEDDTLETSAGAISDNAVINFGLFSNIDETITGELAGLGGDILFRFTKDDGDFLKATINMLNELSNTQTISAPRLVTLSNKPAVIQDVLTRSFRSDITIETNIVGVEGQNPVTTTGIEQEFTDVTEGITLSITPQIQADDTIRLFVLPDIARIIRDDIFEITSSTEGGGETLNTVTRPQVARQSLFTNVVVNDGDTIVIGGLITDATVYQKTGIPFLKDIPLIGRAFENETEVIDRTNLLIFITVNIMDSGGVAYTRLK
jgi:type II secretory pathway component GspD/PulD (secretin)